MYSNNIEQFIFQFAIIISNLFLYLWCKFGATIKNHSVIIMGKHKATATLFLDTRKLKANGKYPLKFTIYCRPNKRRYSTGIDLTLDEWDRLNGKRLKDEYLKEIKMKTNAILNKASKILETLSPFSFQAFEAIMFINEPSKIDFSLEHWFKEYGKLLEAQGREGSRISYNTTYNSLNSFRKNLQINDITKEFLEKYESHMSALGKSSSTIGIYLRQLRAIINRVIKKGILQKENYPYLGFQIPAARNIKKALTDDQLKLLLNHLPSNEKHIWALDFWVFSYLCNGINFTDIAYLRPSSVTGNFLHYIRRKTIRTKKKDLRPIKVALHPRALAIIEKWQNTDRKSVV